MPLPMPYRHVRMYGPDGQRFEDEYLDRYAALEAHRRCVAGRRALLSRVIEQGELSTFTEPVETVLADWTRGDDPAG